MATIVNTELVDTIETTANDTNDGCQTVPPQVKPRKRKPGSDMLQVRGNDRQLILAAVPVTKADATLGRPFESSDDEDVDDQSDGRHLFHTVFF